MNDRVPFFLFGSLVANGTAVYPEFQLVDTIKFQQAYDLVGVYLSSTVQPPGNTAGGTIIVIGTNLPLVRLSESVRVIASQLSAGAGFVTTDFERTSMLDFDRYCVNVRAGESISLYMSGVTLVDGRNFSTCNLFCVPR